MAAGVSPITSRSNSRRIASLSNRLRMRPIRTVSSKKASPRVSMPLISASSRPSRVSRSDRVLAWKAATSPSISLIAWTSSATSFIWAATSSR